MREGAPEVVQGMRAAQRYGGISLAAQAQAARVEGLDGEGRYALRSAYDADELRGCTHGMLLKVCRLKSSVYVEYNRADSIL